MGTRCLVIIEGRVMGGVENKEYSVIYSQFDGYPEGMGREIKDILGGRSVTNGYSDPSTQTNGPGCAAAMLVSGLKKGCGGIYLEPAGTRDRGEDYTYTLTVAPEEPIYLTIDGLYSGTLDDFDPEMEIEDD